MAAMRALSHRIAAIGRSHKSGTIVLAEVPDQPEAGGRRLHRTIQDIAGGVKADDEVGMPVPGFVVLDRKLIINHGEAKGVKRMFGRFLAWAGLTAYVCTGIRRQAAATISHSV